MPIPHANLQPEDGRNHGLQVEPEIRKERVVLALFAGAQNLEERSEDELIDFRHPLDELVATLIPLQPA